MVRPLNFKTYLSLAENSAGSFAFQELWAEVEGRKKNIVRGGDISCAFFVSFILSAFGWLAGGIHATVGGTLRDMEASGWRRISRRRIGCILIWEPITHPSGETHTHIGIYLGGKRAVSNHPVHKVPEVHHFTFGIRRKKPARRVVAMYWKEGIDSNRK